MSMDVKRLLRPPRVGDVADDCFTHDCTTLGGNSGSVVLDLETGQAVGLHCGGTFLKANYAVPAPVIAARLAALKWN